MAKRSSERPTAKDWADVLARLPLFSRCRKRQLRKLAGLAQFKEFAPDGGGPLLHLQARRLRQGGAQRLLGPRPRVLEVFGGPLAHVRVVVIQAGDPSRAFYLILSGQARVGKPRGGLLRTGDYFGEMGLIDGEPRAASIVAVDELQVMTLPRPPFLRLLEQEPGIAVAMLAELAQRVRNLEKSNSAL